MTKIIAFARQRPKPEPDKEIFLDLRQDGDKVRLVMVTENGIAVAQLITFYPNGTMYRHKHGPTKLHRWGFISTSDEYISENYDMIRITR